MSIFKDDEGRTEKPTGERIEKARNKGQTSISKEFTMAASLLAAALTVENLGGWLVDSLRDCLRWGMNVNLATHHLGTDHKIDPLKECMHLIWLIAPPYVTMVAIFVLATMLSGYGQIGIKLSRKALGMKFAKLNPVKNIGNVLNFGSIFKTLFSAGKLVVLGSVLYFVLRSEWETIGAMHQSISFADNVGYIMMLALRIFFWIAFIVLVMAIGDVFWNRYKHTKSLKMTKQEVEDERKRSDGDPMIKGRLRAARFELMKRRMMEAIPKADVVITNPTHYSVAIAYDRSKNGAPEVVAKGLDEIAMRIREIAKQHDVPLMEDPPLARALYRAVDIGHEIPERFFQAVAAVLGHIYRLQGRVA
jgi:flagellar biosynthetic protein FlhB